MLSTLPLPDAILRGRGARRALVWRSAPVRFGLLAFPLWCTAAVLILWTPWRLKLVVGTAALLAFVSPPAGLLATAALAPFGAVLAQLLDVPYRLTEAMVFAFFTGWLLRHRNDVRGPSVPPAMAAAGWLLALAVVCSIAASASVLAATTGGLPQRLRDLLQAYYIYPDPIGAIEGARLIEGLSLAAATVFVFRQRPSMANALPLALCASGAAAVGLALIAWRSVRVSTLLGPSMHIGYRIAHINDPNAAGSFFATLVCLAGGMALRESGRARIGWIALAALNTIGLWFSESRSAIAAAAIAAALAAAWTLSRRRTTRTRLAALAVVVVLGLGLSIGRATLLERDPTFRGGGFRQQFNATSLRMIAARPLSGVGVGQYYQTSSMFLSPQVSWVYGFENAHNYFLQVAAELGVAGLMLFLIWIGAAFYLAARVLARTADRRLLGATAGALALLVTCFTGHPLLVYEVAFPFWIQFGLVLALAESSLINDATAAAPLSEPAPVRADARWPPIWTVTAIAAVVLVAAAIVRSRRGPIEPPQSIYINGLYQWETSEDGRHYRWSEGYASLFVPAEVTRVWVDMRVPVDRRAITPMGVEVAVGGKYKQRTLVYNYWTLVIVDLPEPTTAKFKRIDLKVDRTWQPALYIAESADLRQVGVQVSECQW
jgi:O-antigen ligase